MDQNHSPFFFALTKKTKKCTSPQRGLNSRPLVYKTSALATELWRLKYTAPHCSGGVVQGKSIMDCSSPDAPPAEIQRTQHI